LNSTRTTSAPAAALRAGLRAQIDLRNETHSVSIRRLGSERQQVMPTDEAIAALVEEATPPDVKGARNPMVTSAA
jgi:hypothetical protein